MADLPSSFLKVNDVEVSQDAPVTESIFSKLGSNDNYLKDNLDSETTNRTSADSTLQTQIDTVNGAGPLQSLTTLKSRVENAKNVVIVGGATWTDNPAGGSNDIGKTTFTKDSGNYRIERITGGPFGVTNYVRTVGIDSGIPTTGLKWGEFYVQSTFANLFFILNVYEAQSV